MCIVSILYVFLVGNVMRNCTYLISCFILSFLISCKDDFMREESTSSSDIVSCKVNVPTSFMTRGTPINSEKDTLFKNIGVLGYHTTGKFEETTDPESSFFPNVMISKASGDQWKFSQTYYWPQTGCLSFFAYAPYATETNGISTTNVQGNNPVLTYTLPHAVADQPDLMIATPQKDKFKEEIQLSFSHALACIGFDVSGENVPIDSIGIQGVYTSGTLMLDLTDGIPEWSNLLGNPETFYKVGLIENPSATNPAGNIMATNGYLMMIPQMLDESASIIVKFRGMDPKVIPLNTAGTKEWKAGSKYMYSLKEGVYELSVTSDTYSVPYTGGDFNLKISSTYTKQNGQVEYPGWTAKVIDNNTGEIVWIDGLSGLVDQNGGIDMEKILSVGLAPFKPTSAMDIYLQQQPVIDSISMKDLSFVGGYYSSANCYIVNGPGWYKFPCWVMGNGLTSSSSSGFSTISLNNKCFPTTSPRFVTYKGDSIYAASDLILETANSTAGLVWMDAPELISKIQLSDDGHYIQFYVGPETIRQGNAVIALRDAAGTIMWSWHIWINEWGLFVNDYESFAYYMGNSIGVCYPGEYNYINRSMTLQFIQDSSNIASEITLKQDPMSIKAYLNSPFYQWGRKDPMPGSDGIIGEKPCYGPSLFTVASGAVPIEEAIRNPNVFYTSSGSWSTQINNQLWGESAKSYSKTIYDPCPIVNAVPSRDNYEELTPIQWFPDYPGYGFKYGDQSTVIFMFFGCRDGSTGSLTTIKSIGYYWSNGLGSEPDEYYGISLTSGGVKDVSVGSANAYSIMPVQNGPYPPQP